MSEIKEFITDEEGGVCPECGKHCHINNGASVNGDEGCFYYCPYCGKVSILIFNGVSFIAYGKVYTIPPEADLQYNDIPCIEIRLLAPNPYWKPNVTHYQYFRRKDIVRAMNDAYREDL